MKRRSLCTALLVTVLYASMIYIIYWSWKSCSEDYLHVGLYLDLEPSVTVRGNKFNSLISEGRIHENE